jgi:hypothetical protein
MNSNSGFRIAPFGRGGNVKFLIKVLCCAFALLLLVTASVAAADTLSGISAENFFLLNPEKKAGHVWQQSRFAQADINKTAAVSKSSEKGPTGYTTAQINEMTNNPLGELWMLWMQNDSVWLDGDALDKLGEHSKRFNTVTLEPILPLQLTKEWKLIFRPVIPIASYDVPDSVSLGPPSHIGGLPSVDADWEGKPVWVTLCFETLWPKMSGQSRRVFLVSDRPSCCPQPRMMIWVPKNGAPGPWV